MERKVITQKALSCVKSIYHLLLSSVLIINISGAFANDFAVSVEDMALARTTAVSLLKTLDKTPLVASERDALYGNAGAALKRRYTAQTFDARLIATRGPLGKVERRSFSGYDGGFSSLPNIIAGEYMIIGFHTKFSNRAVEYTEQVTLERDRSGSGNWRLVEYYSAPLK